MARSYWNQLTAKKEEVVRIKTEEEEAHRKKLRMATDSTQKRSLDEINSEAGRALAQFGGSAKKMRRTEPEEDTWTGFSNPRGGTKTRRYLYKTPPGSDDLDDFSIDTEFAGTGLSKGYKP